MDEKNKANLKYRASDFALLTSYASARPKNQRSGFAIAPILYMLGLIGIGAGVLFSGYSQILHSNVSVTNDLATKNDLQAIATTMAATSVLGTTDNTILCPPQGGGASANCAAAPTKLTAISGQSQLPANAANASSTGSPAETGIFVAGSGMKQLDAYGHFYVVCRWEDSTNPGSGTAFSILSAGPDGSLQTKCGDTVAKGDDLIVNWPVATAIQHSAVWQTAAGPGGTQAQFGQVGKQLIVDALGDLTVPGTMAVTGASTFASTGAFTGAVTAPSFTSSGGISGTTGAFSSNVSIGGTLGVTGATTLSSSLSAGASTLASASVTGNATVGGNLGVTGTLNSGAATLASATITNDGAVGGNLGVTGNTNIGGSLSAGAATLASSAVAGNETVGGTFGVAGATTLHALTAGAATLYSASVTGNETIGGTLGVTGDLTGGNGTFSGTLTATNFVGPLTGNVTGTSTNVTGTVALNHGGTGYAASSITDLLTHLGVLSGGYLNMSLLTSNLIPGSDLVNGSVGSTQLDSPVGTNPGTYNWGTVDANGRVNNPQNVVSNALTDGSGDSVTATTSGGNGTLTFSTNGVAQMVLDHNGFLGLGTTTPHQRLDLVGNEMIEGAAGTSREIQYATIISGSPSERWAIVTNSTAESGSNNGSDFAIKNYADNGTLLGTPFTLTRSTGNATFSGNVTANTFYGSGGGLTNIPASSIVGSITANVNIGTSLTNASPQINGDSSSGLYTPAGSTVAVTTGGTERARWDSSGQAVTGNQTVTGSVGIGTTSPQSLLHIYAGSSGGSTGSGSFTLESNGNTYLQILSPSTGVNQIRFGSNVNSSSGNIAYSHASNSMSFYTNVAQRLLIDSSGKIGIGTSIPGNKLDVNGAVLIGYNTAAAAPTNGLAVNGSVVVGNSSATTGAALDLGSNTSSLLLPIGTTGTRPGTSVNGMMRYNSANGKFEAYQQNAWQDILTTGGGGSSINLGTSKTATNPSINGDSSSGFYTPAGSTVAVSAGGVEVEQWNTLASAVDYLSITPGKSGTAPIIAVAGTTTNQNLNLTAATSGAVNITNADPGLQLGGLNGIRFPSSDSTPGASIAIGPSALNTESAAGSAAYANVAIGYQAIGGGTLTTLATQNTAVGHKTLNSLTDGTSNAAFGYWAGRYITTGGYNTALGVAALTGVSGSELTGSYNTGVGYLALNKIATTATQNTAVGVSALSNNTTGQFNTAVGTNALIGVVGSELTGQYNTAIGVSALRRISTTGSFNTAVGGGALYYNTTGTNNTALGVNAMLGVSGSELTGTGNTAIGHSALTLIATTAANNTALGFFAGKKLTTGSNNVIIGSAVATTTLVTGSSNILIGNSASTDTPAASTSNWLSINNAIFGDMSGLNFKIGGSTTLNTGAVLDLSGNTNSLILPVGTTGTRPGTGFNGMMRYNSTNGKFEAYQQNLWQDILTTATGGGTIYIGSSLTGANPQIQGDNTSGLYTPAGSTVAVVTGGTERLRVDSSGNVGIGTTNPAVLLDVSSVDGANGLAVGQSANATSYLLLRGTNGTVRSESGKSIIIQAPGAASFWVQTNGTNRMKIDSSGNVGIGTTAPTNKLDITGGVTIGTSYAYVGQAAPSNGLLVQGSVAIGTTLAPVPFTVVNTSNGAVQFAEADGNTTSFNNSPVLALQNTVSSANNWSEISFSDAKNVGAAGIAAQYLDQANNYGALAFFTRGTGGWGERLRVDSTGNVGIGTTVPGAPLHLYGGSSGASAVANAQLILEANGSRYLQFALPTASTGGIYFGDSASNARGGITYTNSTATTADAMSLITNGNTRIRIDSSGNVGIGTTVPGSVLSVNGGAVIGSYAATGIAAPSNGLIVSGGVAIGASSVTAGTALDLGSTTSSLLLPVGTTGTRPGTGVNGMMRYNSTNGKYEAYQSNAWQDILTSAAGNLLNLGTAKTATNPSISGDLGSGFYTPAGSTVAVSAGGVEVEQWNTLASAVDYLSITPGKSGTAPIIAVAGTTTNQSLNLTAAGTGAVNITSADPGLQLNGANAIRFPSSDTVPGASIAIGPQALNTQNAAGSAGYNNIAIGYQAMGSGTLTTTATLNTAVGKGALGLLTSGFNNAAFGFAALSQDTSGSSNTAFGASSLGGGAAGVLTGNSNTAIGNTAMTAAQGAAATNTAVGGNTMRYMTTGTGNTAIGASAMFGVSATPLTGNSNTAIGQTSLGSIITTGANNTALGFQTGNHITTGTNNLILGYQVATTTLNTGSSNILIGTSSSTDTPAQNTSNWLSINNAIFGDMSGLNFKIGGTTTLNTGAVLDLSANTNSFILPVGTTGTRPGTGFNGMMRYNSTNGKYEAYQSNAWQDILTSAAGNAVNLGTATSANNPSISGDLSSGFYTPAGSTVAVSAGGVEVAQWNTLAAAVDYLSFTPGKSGTAPIIAVAGTTTNQSLNLTAAGTGAVNITSADPGLQLNGNNAIRFPSSDSVAGASIAIGRLALNTQNAAGSFGYGNTAIGYQAIGAGTMTSAAAWNTAVGYTSLGALTSGFNNAAFGWAALNQNTSGSANTAVGASALGGGAAALTGTGNTAVGATALYALQGAAASNTAIGANTMRYITTGASNTALGSAAMFGVSATPLTGSGNTAIGQAALGSIITTGAANTTLGYQTGNKITTGTNNLILGYQVATTTLNTGASNILIGTSSSIDTPAQNTSNWLSINNAIFGDMSGLNFKIGGNTTLNTGAVLDLSGNTNSFILPVGTTGTRPGTGFNGMMRYNSTNGKFEAYQQNLWQDILTTATGGGTIYIGSSLTGTNPQIQGDNTSGLYTPAGSTVSIVTGGVERLRVDSSGNVGIGTTASNARLDVQNSTEADLNLTNTAATSNATWAFTVGSGGQAAQGNLMIAPGVGGATAAKAALTLTSTSVVIGNATNSILSSWSGALNIRPNSIAAGNLIDISTNNLGSTVLTAGTQNVLNVAQAFAPTSGTAVMNTLNLSPTINQTGGASGNTRGIYINPTLTAAANWRALEIASNAGFGIYQSGASATNYFAGNVGIGTTVPSNKLDVSGGVAIGTTYAGLATAPTDGLLVAGNVGIGTTAPGDVFAIANNFKISSTGRIRMNGTSNAANGAVINFGNSSQTFNSASTIYGILGEITNTGTGSLIGASVTPSSTNVGTVASMISLQGQLRTQGATVTQGTAFSAASPVVSSGTFGTVYGLYINQQKVTGVTTGYGIYQADTGDINYFAGATAIGPTASVTAGTALDLGSNTSSLLLPIGTTGTRPGTGVNGMMRYNSTNGKFEAYQQNAWQDILTSGGLGSLINLGTLKSATNPSISGDLGSGFYTPAGSTVAVSAGGVEVEQWNTLASAVDYISVTPGKSGTAPVIAVAGTTTNQNLSLTTAGTGGVNITSASGGLLLAGNNGISVPSADTGSLAIGNGALAGVVTAGAHNTAVGYQSLNDAPTGASNTAVGYQTLKYETTGNNNTAMGVSAMTGISGSELTGSGNTAMGVNALRQIITTAANNTAMGINALYYISTGGGNTAIGGSAMQGSNGNELTGSNNTAVGTNAIKSIQTTAFSNTAVGVNALYYNTTGTGNTAVGTAAMTGVSGSELTGINNTAMGINALSKIQTTATTNTAVGANALTFNTTGAGNTGIGYAALNGVSGSELTGTYNTGLGYAALYKASTTANNNSALGVQTLYYNTTGTNNTAVGTNAMFGVNGSELTGSNNTALGYLALTGITTTGANNTVLGNRAGKAITTGSSNVVIGSATASTTLLTGSSNILIGTSSSTDTPASSTSNWLSINNAIFGDMSGLNFKIGGSTTLNTGAVLDLSGNTNSFILPVGTTGTRPGTGFNGMMRYNSTNGKFEAYQQNAWQDILTSGGLGSAINLGTATSATNPSISGDLGSGFYTPAGSTVAVSAGGVETMEWDTTASGNTYVKVASGASAAPTISVGGTSNGLNIDSSGTGALVFKTNGNSQVQVTDTASAIDYLTLTGSANGNNGPAISTAGSDTVVNMTITTKGGSSITKFVSGNGTAAQISASANAVNYTSIIGVTTGNNPVLVANGSDTNIGLTIRSKGTSGLTFSTEGNTSVKQASISDTASAVNYLNLTGGATGSGPVLSALGTDTNVTLNLTPQGTGAVNITSADPGLQLGGANGIRFPSSDSTVDGSIAIGSSALANQNAAGSAAYDNTAIGYQAMGTGTMTTAAVNNTALGFGALKKITSGLSNTALGSGAASNNTTGGYNTAIGHTALALASTASQNVAIGYAAMQQSTGSSSVAIGYAALDYVNSTGNVAVGQNALVGTTGQSITGNYNTAIGYRSLQSAVTTAAYNTALGAGAGTSLTTGTNNIIVGSSVASTTLTTGSSNILIGGSATDTPASGTSNWLSINNAIFGDMSGLNFKIGGNNTLNTGAVLDLSANTNSFILPVGTTGTRPGTGFNGMMRYNSTNGKFEAYQQNAWQDILTSAAGNAVNLGTATSATNPSISGDLGSGFYTPAGSTVAVSAGGVEVAQWNTLAAAVDYLSFTPGKSGTAPIIAVAGTTTNQNLTLTAAGTGGVNITNAAGLLLAGSNGISVPSADNSSLAVGNGALAGAVTANAHNTAVGYQALNDATTGNSNTVVGFSAMKFSTSGSSNTAIGRSALQSISGSELTGNYNTAVGALALSGITTTGSYNTSMGYNSLSTLTTGTQNTAYGANSMTGTAGSELTGGLNTAIGYNSLNKIQTTAGNNTAVGSSALYYNTTGGNNTAVGTNAMQGVSGSELTGGGNTALGASALNKISTTATNNTALGYTAMQGTGGSELTGTGNTAVGAAALSKIQTTAANNTAMGLSALSQNTTGTQNTAVGVTALQGVSGIELTGSNNAAFGFAALKFVSTTAASNAAIGVNAMLGVSGSELTGAGNTALGFSALSGITTTAANNTVLGNRAGKTITTGSANVVIGSAVASTTLTTGSNNILIGTSASTDTPSSSTSNWLTINNAIFGDMSGLNFKIGGNNTLNTGAVLDLSGNTNSFILPVGTTGTRPGTGFNGMMRYNSTNGKFEAYQQNAWQDILTAGANGSAINLGTAKTATNPSISGDLGSGFYTPAGSTVAVSAGGVEVEQWNTLAAAVDYISITPGKSGTAPIIAVAGTTTNQNLNLTAAGTGSVNITAADPGLMLGGVNGISFPSSDSTAGASIAIGASALSTQDAAGSAAYANTAIGYQAMGTATLTTAAVSNTAVGFRTLRYNSTGSNNTAIGKGTLSGSVGNELTGFYNTAVGTGAFPGAQTTSSYNTILGARAMATSTVASSNTALGEEAMYNATTASSNVAIGQKSMFGSATPLTGTNNVGVGNSTLYFLQGAATRNTAVGVSSGVNITTGNSNTLLGNNVGTSIISGSGNVAIGSSVATTTLTTESGNILIGNSSAVDIPSAGTSNWLNIGNAITGVMGGNFLSFPTSDSTPGASIAIGSQALNTQNAAGSAAYGNTAVGYLAAGSGTMTTGAQFNTALGNRALLRLTSGNSNTVVGGSAAINTTTGSGIVSIGQSTLTVSNPGNYVVAVGYAALGSGAGASVAGGSLAVGGQALQYVSSTGPNTAVGYTAGRYLTSGSYNTLVGVGALAGIGTSTPPTGSANVVLGDHDMTSATSASGNTVLGTNAGLGITTGNNNIAIGTQVGSTTLASGSSNILIGTSATTDTPAAGTNNWLSINNAIFGDMSGLNFKIGGSTTLNTGAVLDLSANTNSFILPVGTTGTRPGTGFNGMMRYNSTNGKFEAYQQNAWQDILTAGANGSAINLGTATSATNPSISGDLGSGFYTPAGSTVAVSAGGVEVAQWNTLAAAVDYISITPGKSGTAPIIAVAGTTTNQSLNLTAAGTGGINITNSDPGLQLNGGNAIRFPSADTSTNSLAIGKQAFNGMTSAAAYNSIAIGYRAAGGGTLTTGAIQNTVVGYGALYSLTSGPSNTAMGFNALFYNTSGVSNTAVGSGTMQGVVATPLTGSGNTAMGSSAFALAQGAALNNAAVGSDALRYSTTGSYNTALGSGAMTSVSGSELTGTYNVAVGFSALGNIQTTAGNNTGLGTRTLQYATTANNNTAVGYGALYGVLGSELTGGNNVGVGAGALSKISTTANNNTAVGANALNYNTTGTSNTAVGMSAMLGISGSELTGSANTAVGYQALDKISTTAASNTAVGSSALFYNTTGSNNTALGTNAMQGVSGSELTGSGNTALGNAALNKIQTTALGNTAVGNSALFYNTTGSSNTALGNGTMQGTGGGSELTGTQNTGLGAGALSRIITTAAGNTAVGGSALFYNTTGTGNTAVGNGALIGVSGSELTGGSNTAIGKGALGGATTTAASNTALGYQAGRVVTTGASNLVLGYNVASSTLNTGSSNILIGTSSSIDTPAAGTSNWLTINNAIFGDMSGLNFKIGGNNTLNTGAVLDLSSQTNSLLLPTGTTGTRPGTGTNGMMRYNSTTPALEAYVNNVWASLATGSSGSNLGTAKTATNPSISGDLGSGFYTPAGSTVAVSAGGVEVEQWNTLASAVDYLSITPGKSGTAPIIAVAGTTTNQSLNLTSAGTGTVNITSADTGLTLNSVTAIRFPSSDSTANASIAIGRLALNGQNAAGSAGYNNTAIGYSSMSGALTTAATGNTAVGYGSLSILTSGGNNSALGWGALSNNTSGSSNTAFGASALGAAGATPNTGNGNTAVGTTAMYVLAGAAADNTAIGNAAMRYISTGTGNTALGSAAMFGVNATPLTGSGNTAIGRSSLGSIITTGAANTVLGYQTGSKITTGLNNLALGYQVATTTLTTETGNILIGTSSGVDIPSAGTNSWLNIGNVITGVMGNNFLSFPTSDSTVGGSIAIGSSALNTQNAAGSAAYANTAIGYRAMGTGTMTTTATFNTVVGNQAGKAITAGAANDLFGAQAGIAITTANYNTVLGNFAMSTTTSGQLNVAIGRQALAYYNNAVTNNDDNVAVGALALTGQNGVTGRIYNNTAVGYSAGANITTGTANTYLGYQSGKTVTTGASNVAIGNNVGGTTLATGSSNILIGTSASTDTPASSTSNWLTINNAIFGDMSGLNFKIGGSTTLNTGAVLDLSSQTNSLLLPTGTTGTRPGTGTNGMLRYNSTTPALEAYVNNAWSALSTGGSGSNLGASVTANNPSISGDLSSGLYTPAGSTVAITTGGTERLRVDSTGKVGIGTTIPQAAFDLNTNAGRLRLTQNTSGSVLNGIDFANFNGIVNASLLLNQSTGEFRHFTASTYFPTFYSNGTEAMRITTTGNVGIGTTVPGSTLAVNGGAVIGSYAASGIAAPSNGLIVSGGVAIGASSVTAGTALDLGSNTSSLLLPIGTTGTRPGTGVNGMLRYNSTTPALEAYVNNTWSSLATAAGNSNLGASVTTNNPSISGDNSSGLYTPTGSTVAVATGGVERLRVDSSGKVGIGTSVPAANFHLYGTNTTTNVAQIDAPSLTTGSALTINGPSGATGMTFPLMQLSGTIGNVGALGMLNSAAIVKTSNPFDQGVNLNLTTSNTNTSGANIAMGINNVVNDSTALGNIIYGINNNITSIGNAAKTAYGIISGTSTISTVADTQYGSSSSAIAQGVVTSGTQKVYGAYSSAQSSNMNGGTANVYGVYTTAAGTVTSGTINVYGLYVANGVTSTAGTATKYGLYIEPQTGSTNNYGAYIGGNVGINVTPSGTNPLIVGSNSSNGNGAYLAAAGTWTNVSDRRIKENIHPIQYGLDTVMKLDPVAYDMKQTHEHQVGFIAQDVLKVVPEVVGVPKDPATEHYGLSYGNMVAVTVKAIQELKADNDNLRKQIVEVKQQGPASGNTASAVSTASNDRLLWIVSGGFTIIILFMGGFVWHTQRELKKLRRKLKKVG